MIWQYVDLLLYRLRSWKSDRKNYGDVWEGHDDVAKKWDELLHDESN